MSNLKVQTKLQMPSFVITYLAAKPDKTWHEALLDITIPLDTANSSSDLQQTSDVVMGGALDPARVG